MEQDKKVDQLEDAILDKLSDEAVQRLADLADLEGDHAAEIQAILDEQGVDPHTVAEELFGGETHE